MNSFCEECGNKLEQGDIFCQQCGTETGVNAAGPHEESSLELGKREGNDGFGFSFDFFREKRPSSELENSDCLFGVILTNFEAFSQKWGQDQTRSLHQQLNSYVEGMKHFGLCYLVLDVSDTFLTRKAYRSWQDHVNLLRAAIKHTRKKLKDDIRFVMIFGGHEIIPMAVFPNPLEGLDPDIDSDVPYSTLSIRNPLKKKDAATLKIAVGRMPTGPDTSAADLVNLLQNTLDALVHFSIDKTFGMSCLHWQEPSSVVNSQVARGKLHLSPSLSLDNLHNYYSDDINLHYFNLHGIDGKKASTWLGQNEYKQQHPKCRMDHAFSPAAIAASRVLNVIGVEACYGAKFVDIEKDYSILLTAMANKTVSFAGASRIAIGPPKGININDADIIIRDYLGYLQNKVPAGYALLNAKNNLIELNIDTRPAEAYLSFIEFNLFGDPAFIILNDDQKASLHPKQKASLVSSNTSYKGYKSANDLEYQEPDSGYDDREAAGEDSVYQRVRREVDVLSERIIALINKNVWNDYPEFKDVHPSVKRYSYEGKSHNSLTYKQKGQFMNTYLLVSADDSGNIIQVSQSK